MTDAELVSQLLTAEFELTQFFPRPDQAVSEAEYYRKKDQIRGFIAVVENSKKVSK